MLAYADGQQDDWAVVWGETNKMDLLSGAGWLTTCNWHQMTAGTGEQGSLSAPTDTLCSLFTDQFCTCTEVAVTIASGKIARTLGLCNGLAI